jgi:CubicO group peptidase (beta-lactamase class C family)
MDSLQNKIKQAIDSVIKDRKVVAIAVGVTDKKGTIACYNYGVADLSMQDQITEKTLFRIASISKIVTGLTAIKLAEMGKLDLYSPIGDYIYGLDIEVANLTLDSLLSHTAGLPAEYTPDGPRDESLLESAIKSELANVDLSKVGNNKPVFYSNLGIRLASLVCQKMWGKPFSQTAKELILNPLKMQNTTYYLKEAQKIHLAKPYELQEDKFIEVAPWENAVRFGAGVLFSNTIDLCKLARFMLNDGVNDCGERIISKQLICDMAKSHGVRKAKDHYGQTLMLHDYNGRFTIGHLGSAPPYFACLQVDKQSGYGVTLCMNTGKDDNLRYLITDAVLSAITKEKE